jgi:GT2 family glycosyltransferase
MDTADSFEHKGSPQVSIIIPTYNGRDYLVDCIHAVLSNTGGAFELIVVDDCSTDGTAQVVEDLFRDSGVLKVAHCPVRRGHGAACEIGIGNARGQLLILLDNDTEVQEGWLDQLLRVARTYPDAGAIQAKLLWHKDRARIQHGGGQLNLLGSTAARSHMSYDHLSKNDAEEIFFAAGAAMLTYKDVILQCGGFDSEFTILDDADLGWRMRLRGYRVFVANDSRVLHHGSKTIANTDYLAAKLSRTTYEHLGMVIKNRSLSSLLKILPALVLLRISYVLLLIARRLPRLALASLAGLVRALCEFRQIWEKHQLVQSRIRRQTDEELTYCIKRLYPSLILWAAVKIARRTYLILFDDHAQTKLCIRTFSESALQQLWRMHPSLAQFARDSYYSQQSIALMERDA